MPGRVCGVADPAAVLDLVTAVTRAAADTPFLVSIEGRDGSGWAVLYACPWGWSLGLQDGFGLGPGDVFTTCEAGDGGESWDFQGLFGQGLDWPRRYFTDPGLVRRALAAYLATRKLWRGVSWGPVPAPTLLVDEPAV